MAVKNGGESHGRILQKGQRKQTRAWLLNRDPYSGLVKFSFNWVGHHPLYTLNNQAFSSFVTLEILYFVSRQRVTVMLPWCFLLKKIQAWRIWKKTDQTSCFRPKIRKTFPDDFTAGLPPSNKFGSLQKLGGLPFFPLHYVVERWEKMAGSARANSLRVFCIRSMLFQSGSAGWYVNARYASHKWRFRLGLPKSPGGDWHPGWGVDTNNDFFWQRNLWAEKMDETFQSFELQEMRKKTKVFQSTFCNPSKIHLIRI